MKIKIWAELNTQIELPEYIDKNNKEAIQEYVRDYAVNNCAYGCEIVKE